MSWSVFFHALAFRGQSQEAEVPPSREGQALEAENSRGLLVPEVAGQTRRDDHGAPWSSVEAIVGAVTGSLRQPEVLVVGPYRGKDLEVVGRTVR